MIKAENLTYNISGKNILNSICLDIERGETLAVMGISGVGKSTLLKCIAGLIKPTSGKLFIDGIDIAPLNENKLIDIRKKIGMVFQYAALFDSLTVYENVSFGLRRHFKLTEAEIAEIVDKNLKIVGMANTQHLYPSQLSGGMQKRVGLARSLAMNPEIILYDEPTAGLDPIISAAIADLIKKTRDELGVTSVFVSHDIPTIKAVSTRIAMLHQGVIVQIGSVEEIINSDNPYVNQFINGRADGPIKATA